MQVREAELLASSGSCAASALKEETVAQKLAAGGGGEGVGVAVSVCVDENDGEAVRVFVVDTLGVREGVEDADDT